MTHNGVWLYQFFTIALSTSLTLFISSICLFRSYTSASRLFSSLHTRRSSNSKRRCIIYSCSSSTVSLLYIFSFSNLILSSEKRVLFFLRHLARFHTSENKLHLIIVWEKCVPPAPLSRERHCIFLYAIFSIIMFCAIIWLPYDGQ